jgi:acyl carrier protein
MSIKDFLEMLEPEFDDVAPGTIHPDTEFRTLNGWSSMMSLIVISKINKHYKVNISAQELADAKTIVDLFHITTAKLQSVS